MASRKGGLVNKKMSKFATMSDYLEAHHPKVYELFTYLGMQGALTPRRGGGLTLLIPDSKTVADLHKIIESDDAEKASDILSGLVIQDNLGSEKEWAEKQDDVPTLLGKRVPVKSVSAGKVVLDGGAELTLDKSAKFLSRVGRKTRDPMSVWLIKGSFDPTSAPDATYKYVSKEGKGNKEKSGKVRGGLAAAGNWSGREKQRDYVNSIMKQTEEWLANGASGASPAAVAMLRLFNYLKANSSNPTYKDLTDLVGCFCRGSTLSDFLAVWNNPLATKDFRFNELLNKVQDSGFETGDARQTYKDFLSDPGWRGQADKDTSAQLQEITRAVEEELEKGIQRPSINFAEKIKKMCEQIEKTGMVGSVMVFPDSVRKVLAEHPGLFLLMEEHYYFIAPRWASLVKSAQSSSDRALVVKQWKEFASDLKYRFDRSGNPAQLTQMDKKEYYSVDGLTDNAGLANCVRFWRSAFMRFTPVDAKYGGSFDHDEFEDAYSRELVNMRLLGAEEIDNLPSEDMGLSERARMELMAYKQKHGKLPDL